MNRIDYSKLYKYLDIMCDGYYNPKRILTYRRPVNVITGSRSVGKSTAISALFLLDYIIQGHWFIYSRRDEKELLKTCKDFFDDARELINFHADRFGWRKIKCFKYDAQKYIIEREGVKGFEQCGFVVPMSIVDDYKSGKYGQVYSVCWDEIIAMNSKQYLGTKDSYYYEEYRAARSLVTSCDRRLGEPIRNEVTLFLLGNSNSIFAPMFVHLGISDYLEYSENAKFISPKGRAWVYQSVGSVEALDKARGEGSNLDLWADDSEIAYNNNAGRGLDNKEFISKLPDKGRSYCFTIIKDGTPFGVWRTVEPFHFYISKRYAKGFTEISIDLESHTRKDAYMVLRFNTDDNLKILRDQFQRGRLFFTDGKTKQSFLRYFSIMP